MKLSERDYKLSMRTSPRSVVPERNEGLRSLLVHRLRDAAKLVVRLPNKTNIAKADSGHYKMTCETCGRWFPLPDWGEEIKCPGCGEVFALEFAVFSRIPSTDYTEEEVQQAAATVNRKLPPPQSIGAVTDAPADLATNAEDYLAEGFGGD